jgi:two-component system nitrogen regulation response regulator NtrX
MTAKHEASSKEKPVALVVDDETSICDSLSGVLADEGWNVKTANSGDEGLKSFLVHKFDLVFLDVWMEGIDGIETLQRMRDKKTDVPIVIMSGHGTIETAVKATKLGALQFLEKPLSIEKILPILDAAQNAKDLPEKLDKDQSKKYLLIGESKQINAIRRQISIVSPRNSWVLITGENGTGKEVVARNIHLSSKRIDKPFVAVNCAAIPEELIESELFGHSKGAFTNATSDKRGKFELANHGTLFLDEIGDMSMKTQAKILRILQEQQFERVGGHDTISVDVRVVAATNKNLEVEIANGNFREDLYYRLNVIPIEMPALRDRKGDIPLLVEYFLSVMAKEIGEPKKTLSKEAMTSLTEYHWPGNVREVRNMIERITILVENSSVSNADLPSLNSKPSENPSNDQSMGMESYEGLSLKKAREEFEKQFILLNLEKNEWNVSKTAEAIGIERSNLHRKLRAYSIDPKQLKG